MLHPNWEYCKSNFRDLILGESADAKEHTRPAQHERVQLAIVDLVHLPHLTCPSVNFDLQLEIGTVAMVILNMHHDSSLNLIHAIAHPNLPSQKPETYTAQTPATNACDFWRNPLVFHGISVQKICQQCNWERGDVDSFDQLLFRVGPAE